MFATLEQALEAVKNNADSYKEVVAPLNGDKALAIMAVAKNGRLLKHCNNELRADLEVVYQACSNAPIAIMFADFYIKEKVIGNDGDLLQKLKILMDYKEVKEALEEPKQEQQPKVEEVATTTPTVEVEPEAPAQDLFTDSVIEPNQEEQLIQGQIGEESQEPEVEEKVEEKKATNSNKKAKANNKAQNKGKKPVAKKGEKQEPETEKDPE